MKIELCPPKIHGSIDVDILEKVPEVSYFQHPHDNELTHRPPSTELSAVFEALKEATALGASSEKYATTLFGHEVGPSLPRLSGAARWHTDMESQIGVSTVPTEFPVGTLKVPRQFRREIQKLGGPKKPLFFDKLCKIILNKIEDDDELKRLGVEPWSARPGELYEIPAAHAHRSPVNNTVSPRKEVLLLLHAVSTTHA